MPASRTRARHSEIPSAPVFPLKISFSATNPCHLYDMARELHRQGALGRYYSGYPRWKLDPPEDFPVLARSARTLATYAALRLPHGLRPADHRLFRWQDEGFDKAVARALGGDPSQMLHALPGQALETFRAAHREGITTILNHACGPVRQQLALLEEEYRRAGIEQAAHHSFNASYLAREAAEYSLADRHCVASSVVRRQLLAAGIPEEKIWIVPYGADPARFHPPESGDRRDPLKVVYAGQMTLRKGLRIALAGLRSVRNSVPVTFDLYGSVSPDFTATMLNAQREEWVSFKGPVSQHALADIFRKAAVLVLPSWEEAFGLVVVQALNCGLPCVVSDRVGAADLIQHRRNGSIFPAGDDGALAREVSWWLEHRSSFEFMPFHWEDPARRLLALSTN